MAKKFTDGDLSTTDYPLHGVECDPGSPPVLPVTMDPSGDLVGFVQRLWNKSLESSRKKALRERWDVHHGSKPFLTGEYDKTLGRFQDVLDGIGYELTVLARRGATGDAYSVLIRVIAALGSPLCSVSAAELPKPGSVERFLHDRRCAFEVLQRFCSVFAPDCWTAYYRNRRLNRVYRLDCDSLSGVGLSFPEAMEGFVWRRDLPTQLLFSDRSTTLFPPFPDSEDGLVARNGKFQDREGIDPKRVVGIRLSWDQSRCVVLLNWKRRSPEDEEEYAKDRPALRGVWSDLRQHYSAESQRPDSPMQSLQMAVRYFTGWLSVSGIDLSEALEFAPTTTQPGQAIRRVVAAAFEDTREAQGKDLCTAVSNLLDVHAHCSLHWTNTEEYNGHSARSVLTFQQGEYEDGETQPSFHIRKDGDGLVERSICALSALWDIPLLIRDFTRRIHGRRTWQDLHYPRTDVNCTSEIAVPMCDEQGTLCVLNVECHARERNEDLGPIHVREAELMMHLFQALRMALDSDDTPTRRFLKSQLKHHPRSAQRLMKEFFGWVQGILGTDLAFALIYDPHIRVFRPLGVTLSNDVVNHFLANDTEVANLNRRGKAAAIELKESNARDRQIHSLVEHAIASRLLPRRRGKTWKVYTRGKPILACAVDDHNAVHGQGGSEPKRDSTHDPTINEYARIRFATPLAFQLNAKEDGVVWLAWRSQDRIQNTVLRSLDIDTFSQEVSSKISRVLAVVAAAYAVFRYFDPNSATDPLPYRIG